MHTYRSLSTSSEDITDTGQHLEQQSLISYAPSFCFVLPVSFFFSVLYIVNVTLVPPAVKSTAKIRPAVIEQSLIPRLAISKSAIFHQFCAKAHHQQHNETSNVS